MSNDENETWYNNHVQTKDSEEVHGHSYYSHHHSQIKNQILSQSHVHPHQVKARTNHHSLKQQHAQQIDETFRYGRIKSFDPYFISNDTNLSDNSNTTGSLSPQKLPNRSRGRKKYYPSLFKKSSERSLSSGSGYLDGVSPLDDPMFAPPPIPPINVGTLKDGPFASTLPSFSKVKHSGNVLARISLKSLFLKKWRQLFWIAYGDHSLIFFRSQTDFYEWATNPYLNDAQRMDLIKLQIDLKNDMLQPGVRCYRATSLFKKKYGRWGLMYTFKLEQWMYYGPIIAGAFASSNRRESRCLLIIMKEMIKRQKNGLTDFLSDAGSIHYDSDNQDGLSSSFSIRSAPA